MNVEDLRDPEKDKLVEQMVEECVVKLVNPSDTRRIRKPDNPPMSKPRLQYRYGFYLVI